MSSLPPSGRDMDATLAGPNSGATPRRKPSALERGVTVGRYVVIDRVGQGGMGIVYAAYDPELDRKVAVKLLAPGRDGESDGSADRVRLVREAQAMAKLAHAHVVAVHDAGTHEGSVFIAMEFVEGGTLAAKMAEQPPWRTLLPWFLQAGAGLAAAHAAGLVHRDFKPDNVLITKDGTAKVSDFGLARAAASLSTSTDPSPDPALRPVEDVLASGVTRVGAIVGTPAYMAPEQLLHHVTDARSDQFSFCVALYEALYGTRPFSGRGLPELAYAISRGMVAAAPTGASVPARLRKVVLRGLAVDPDARWPSMQELLAALRIDPSRRRTRLLALGGLGLAILGSAGGLAALDRHEREVCAREGAAVYESWNDETRAQITAAMRATELPYADTTIERVGARLDAWTSAWASAREEVCTAAADDPHDDLPPLRYACLAERRVHLDVTLELLVGADVLMTSSAVHTVAALPRLDPCEDGRWLRQRGAQLGGGAAGVNDALEVTRLVALTRARRSDRAMAMAQELLVDTADVPYLQAEVLLTLGQLEEASADIANAIKHLEAAYFLAGTHNNDRVAALAAIQLVMLAGVRKGDNETARRWTAHATMMVERSPDPELRHELLYVVGAVETNDSHHEAAISAFLQQAELALALYGPEHPENGYAELALGHAYSNAGRPEDARAHYERAHELWARVLGENHPSTLTVVFSLAELAQSDGRFEDALRLHRQALVGRESIRRSDHFELAQSHSAIGDVLSATGDHAGALVEHRRSLATYDAILGSDAPLTWGQVDKVVLDLIALDRAAEAEPLVVTRCNAAEHERADSDGWIRCLVDRGELLRASGQHADAAALFAEAVSAAEQRMGPTHRDTRSMRLRWARALLAEGDTAQARAQLERISAEWNADSAVESHPERRAALELLGPAPRARAG